MEETEVKVKEKNCLNCTNLFSCPDILGYSCKKYQKAEQNKADVSTRYMEVLKRISGLITELAQIEMEMKVAEKTDLTSKIREKSLIPEGMTEKQFRNMLKETNMTPEDWEQLPTQAKENIAKAVQKEVKEPEKPAISRRNKEIIKLVEQGKGVREIAEELKLEPETVKKELEYLLKNGMVKTFPS
jgi:ATP/maltotriose-dependent transcriptional regulator MalT